MDEEGGYYLDDGTKVPEDSIPVPDICLSCAKNGKNVVVCNLTRMGQMEEMSAGEMFCCFAYEPADPSIDKEAVIREMERASGL